MKISIITVSLNCGAAIKNCIDSVLSQSYGNVEYIVIDGVSQDETISVIKEYSDRISCFVSEPDKGIYDAMNKGVRRATGDVIGILNSDDFYLHENVLSEVHALFSADPELEVVLGDVDFVHEWDLNRPVRTYRAWYFKPWMFRFGLMPPHPAVFVRKSAYDRIGFYKLGYKIAADFDFLTRLLLVDRAKYELAHKTWVRMRIGGVSTSGIKSNLISTGEMRRSLSENGLFANSLMLLCRLPFKLMTQVLGK